MYINFWTGTKHSGTCRRTRHKATKSLCLVLLQVPKCFVQTFSVRTFWPAPARTSHKIRNVRRTHPHTIFCARTRTRTRTFFQKIISNNFFFLVFLLKIKSFTKKKSVRTCGAHLHLRGAHARTRTHIFENFCAPLRTKIAAPARVRVRAHARTLKV